MAAALTRFSNWLWRTNKNITSTDNSRGKSNDPPNPDLTSDFREMDSVRFPRHHSSRPRTSTKKRRGRLERRIDRDYDMVIVPSDGGCVSGSESDVSDVSIAFMEPHAPDFMSEDDGSDDTNGFAVLVPCYRHGRAEQPSIDADSSDGKNFLEQWLSSLQN